MSEQQEILLLIFLLIFILNITPRFTFLVLKVLFVYHLWSNLVNGVKCVNNLKEYGLTSRFELEGRLLRKNPSDTINWFWKY